MSPTTITFADDVMKHVKFDVQPIPTRHALENWHRVRQYLAILKLILPVYVKRFPVRNEQIILLQL